MPPPSAAGVLSADTRYDPEHILVALSWLLVVGSIAQVLAFSFGRDQGIYATVAEGILQGELPYRDRWDFKPPGIFLVYALAFSVFGPSMIAPRLVEALFMVGTVLGLRRLGGIFFASRTAGMMAGAIYAMVHAQMDFWHTGQPESFAGPLTVYAMVLTTHTWSRHRQAFAWLGIGMLFGLAFLLKPPLGGGAIACAYFLSAERRSEGRRLLSALAPFAWIGAASALPILACIAWFSAAGAWSALHWTLFEFAPGYTALGWRGHQAGSVFFQSMSESFFGLSSLIAFGTIAAAAIHPRAEREREGFLLILGVLAFQLIGVTLQAKFFQYHFGASIPLLALISASGFYKLWRRLGPASPTATITWAAFVIASATLRLPVRDLPGSFWSRTEARMMYLLSGGRSPSREELDEKLHYIGGYNLHNVRQAAHAIEQAMGPGQCLYVWGFEPLLYSLSKSVPCSRYIYNVPQRARWQREAALEGLYRDLRRHPPAAVVTQTLDVLPEVTGTRRDSTDSLPHYGRLQHWLTAGYAPSKTIDRFTIWLPREMP